MKTSRPLANKYIVKNRFSRVLQVNKFEQVPRGWGQVPMWVGKGAEDPIEKFEQVYVW